MNHRTEASVVAVAALSVLLQHTLAQPDPASNVAHPGWPEGHDRKTRTQTPLLYVPLVSTIAGKPSPVRGDPGLGGYWEGVGPEARFRYPTAIAATGPTTSSAYGASGLLSKPILYVVDSKEHRIRKIQSDDQHRWMTSLVSGNGKAAFADGAGMTANVASFNGPTGIAVTRTGATAYVTDRENDRIRSIRLSDGYTTTLAGRGGVSGADPNGGLHDNADGTLATFNRPTSIALSPDESYVLVSEQGSTGHVIRKVYTSTGATSIWMGAGTALSSPHHYYMEGTGTNARFYNPAGMAFDAAGTYVYVADSGNHVIRRIKVATATVEPWAGSKSHGWDYQDGYGTDAKFGTPWAITIHDIKKCDGTVDSRMFVAERGNNRIRVIDMDTVRVTTLAGVDHAGSKDGSGSFAEFFAPSGVAAVFASAGLRVLYVADMLNHAIRRIPLEIEVPRCQDINIRATLTFEDHTVPLGSDLVVNWRSDDTIDATDWLRGDGLGGALSSWGMCQCRQRSEYPAARPASVLHSMETF